ncbi:DUF2993 domain-containing protein [Nocardia asteroides]|uniref:DUF2993 domain-containing protein n=1 Tax=Nocardia asteroides TaxID=1824 RepID=UPI0037C85A44
MIGLVVALLLAVIGVTSTEIYLRNRIEQCLAAGLRDELGASVSVGLGARPVVYSLLDRRLPVLTVDSDDARFGPAVGMEVHARLEEVSQPEGSDTAVVAGSEARVEWSAESIEQTLGGIVTDVRTSADSGTVDVTALAGAVTVRLRPSVQGGVIHIETVSTRGVPPQLTSEIVDLLARSLGGYPLELRPESVTVTDAGIRVDLRGGTTSLPVSGGSC